MILYDPSDRTIVGGVHVIGIMFAESVPGKIYPSAPLLNINSGSDFNPGADLTSGVTTLVKVWVYMKVTLVLKVAFAKEYFRP